jgi:hypothetical protein
MGGYVGLLGIIGHQGKNPLFLVKKIQNKNGYPFFVLFLVKNIGFLVAHLSGRQAKCPYIMGPILPAALRGQQDIEHFGPLSSIHIRHGNGAGSSPEKFRWWCGALGQNTNAQAWQTRADNLKNTMHTRTNAKMNYKGVNYRLVLDHPEANETATSWVTKLQSQCQRVVDLPPDRQKLFCKYLWSGQLNIGSLDLGKISHKLTKSHTKNKPISLRMVGWKKVKQVVAPEKFVDGARADQCCCTMKTHSIVFVGSLLVTAVAIVLRCYNKSN